MVERHGEAEAGTRECHVTLEQECIVGCVAVVVGVSELVGAGAEAIGSECDTVAGVPAGEGMAAMVVAQQAHATASGGRP